MRSLTMALRLELHSFGIKVAIIEPGVIRANFLQNQVGARGNANPDSPSRRHGPRSWKSARPASTTLGVIR